MKKSFRLFWAAMIFIGAPCILEAQTDSDSLKPRVDALVKPVIAAGLCPGLVVGLIDQGQTRVWGYGTTSNQNSQPPGADTEFEIASITKLFNNLLFSDMIHRGQMGLNDPAQNYVPTGIRMPMKDGREITLLMLSNHTSGLPDWPDDISAFDGTDPKSDYTFDQLYQFLSRCPLSQTPGTSFLYSCLGASLLGDLVARKNGTSWTAYLQKRILDPLGMKDTAVVWTPGQLSLAAAGFDGEDTPPRLWKYPSSLLPEGSLHSTVNDLFKLARAGLNPADQVLSGIAFDETAAKLDWGPVVTHEGESGDGFNSSFCLDRPHQTFLIIWGRCNTSFIEDLADRVERIMAGTPYSPIPLPAFVFRSKDELKAYAGSYQIVSPLGPGISPADVKISLTAAPKRLIGQGPKWWMDHFSLFPLADGSFYVKRDGSIITFQKDNRGVAANFQSNGNAVVTAEKSGSSNSGAADTIPPPP